MRFIPRISCMICSKPVSENLIGCHVKKEHDRSFKQYYDEFFKQEGEGKCKVCGSDTRFGGTYSQYCSSRCSNRSPETRRRYRDTCRLIYHCDNSFQDPTVKSKSKQTMLDKFGVENCSQSDVVKNKKKETCQRNYGVDNPPSSPVVQSKIRHTNIERYGFPNAMHNPEVAARAAINGGGRAPTRMYTTKFGNSIRVQGSFEVEFVRLCDHHYIPVENGPCIRYEWGEKVSRYFVDFKIKTQDGYVLVEVKSSYWLRKFPDQVKAKEQAARSWCLANGLVGYHLMVDQVYIPMGNERLGVRELV